MLTTLRAIGERSLHILHTAGTYNYTLAEPERDLLERVHQKIRSTAKLHQPDNQERHLLNSIGHHLETGWSVGQIRRFLGKKAYVLEALYDTNSSD